MLEREEKDWGVRLMLRPLSDLPEMTITAEINKPKPNKTPETRFRFVGTPANQPIRKTQLMAWQMGLKSFLDAVTDEAAQLREKTERSLKRKKA